MSLADDVSQHAAHDAPIEPEQVRDEHILVASQWQLMWWKFRKHKLALVATVVIVLLYLVATFVEFVAPYDPEEQEARMAYRPPTRIHFVDGRENLICAPSFTARSPRETSSRLALSSPKTARGSIRYTFSPLAPHTVCGGALMPTCTCLASLAVRTDSS